MAQQGPPPSEDMDDLFGSRKQRQSAPRRVEIYAEENFEGADLTRTVHVGWGAAIGAAAVLFCMGISAATKAGSWNVSFRWLQRRVGFQFGTMTYLITSNLLYYYDGDKWVTRDWPAMVNKWTRKDKGPNRGFAAAAAAPGQAA